MKYEVSIEPKPALLENHLNLGGKNLLEDIRVNSRYISKNGITWIPIMGEFHYVRVAREVWEEELQKMKAGGITVISCYIIWIYHEEKEGEFCFDGNRNLREFIQIASKCGLKVIIRIGPWVHGEVRNGGFPDWLLNKNIKLREDDPEYLQYVKIFYQAIYEQVQPYLFANNGPIWGIQLENELTDQAGHLLTLRRLAEEIGLKAPVYTVTGWNSKYGAQIPEYDVLPVFGGYSDAPWENHKNKLEPSSHYFFLPVRNDSSIGKDLIAEVDDADVFHMNYDLYPFATCELGGGLPTTYHRRPVASSDDIAALALVKMGSGNNMPGYYMYHGGINDIGETTLQESKKTGYPNDYPIRNYDFQAPVGACGQLRSSYRKLKLQHLFLQKFGKYLAGMDAYFQKPQIEDRNDVTHLRYSIRTDGTSGFVFVNNYQRLDTLAEHENVQFIVPTDKGDITFPRNGMTIPSGAYLFLPYNFKLGKTTLKYATAQLLCQSGDTWFFFSPFGIAAEYCIAGADGKEAYYRAGTGRAPLKITSGDEVIQIVTLTQEDAEHFYVAANKIFVTNGADIYDMDGKLIVRQEGNPDLTCYKWNGSVFDEQVIRHPAGDRNIAFKEIELSNLKLPKYNLPKYKLPYEDAFFLDGERRIKGYSIHLPADLADLDTLLRFDYIGDVMQIYVNGVLAIDDYYKGSALEVGTQELLRYGNDIEVWISELKEGICYLECEEKEGCSLKEIQLVHVYKEVLEEN